MCLAGQISYGVWFVKALVDKVTTLCPFLILLGYILITFVWGVGELHVFWGVTCVWGVVVSCLITCFWGVVVSRKIILKLPWPGRRCALLSGKFSMPFCLTTSRYHDVSTQGFECTPHDEKTPAAAERKKGTAVC